MKLFVSQRSRCRLLPFLLEVPIAKAARWLRFRLVKRYRLSRLLLSEQRSIANIDLRLQ